MDSKFRTSFSMQGPHFFRCYICHVRFREGHSHWVNLPQQSTSNSLPSPLAPHMPKHISIDPRTLILQHAPWCSTSAGGEPWEAYHRFEGLMLPGFLLPPMSLLNMYRFHPSKILEGFAKQLPVFKLFSPSYMSTWLEPLRPFARTKI